MTTEDRIAGLVGEAVDSRAALHDLLANGPDEAIVPIALAAIVDQMALANALTIVQMARAAGEPGA